MARREALDADRAHAAPRQTEQRRAAHRASPITATSNAAIRANPIERGYASV